MGVDKGKKCDISWFGGCTPPWSSTSCYCVALVYMVIVPCVCQNNTLGSGCTVLAMEDAIINEIANKCEVDTCEISDQVTNSKEAEGSEDAWVQGRRGYMQRLILCTRRMREE